MPNPYLKDSLRDLITTDGMKLTKINPAYMTRQIAELNDLRNDLKFHITSLNPIRPANKADSWESKSLEMFENGVAENMELVDYGSVSHYRYMAPLITEKSCLSCHAEQGYKLGDIRGGISISFSANDYLASVSNQIFALGVVHIVVFFLGAAGLWIYYRMSNKYLSVIENRNIELAQINATKDKFFSIIGHDLRTPFNGIIGFSDVLIEQINNNKFDEVKVIAEIIHNSSLRAMDLLSNLLEWSRTQTGRMEIIPEDFDFKDVVDEVQKLLNEAALHKSINITKDLIENGWVFADRKMINTVTRNLVSNAIKFTNTGGKINISTMKKNNEMVVTVTDNGVGIKDEMISRLFIISKNNSTPGTENEEGTGLGLILCKEFVEKNNGKIWVESSVGNGSSFHFTIPIVSKG